MTDGGEALRQAEAAPRARRVDVVVPAGLLALALAGVCGCGVADVPTQPVTLEHQAQAPVLFAMKPRQDEAVAVVLRSFGEPVVPMRLEWVEGAGLDCGPASFVNVDGACVYGTVEWESPPRVRVGWEPTDRFSTTTLAHELCHLYFGDPDHDVECGTKRPATRVLGAEQALRDAGL